MITAIVFSVCFIIGFVIGFVVFKFKQAGFGDASVFGDQEDGNGHS